MAGKVCGSVFVFGCRRRQSKCRSLNSIQLARSTYRPVQGSGKTEDDNGKTSWKSLDSKRSMNCAVNRWHREHMAYLLGRMKELNDGEGSLLDNSMLFCRSSLSDGQAHGDEDLPLMFLAVAQRRSNLFVRYPLMSS